MKETVQEISLQDVYLDRETQIRAAVSEETIQRYFEIMVDEEGRDKFPPIKLFQDDEGKYWLADGHHRVMAAKRRKFTSILAEVEKGTKADAVWEAAKANSKNGLQLGRSDIRRAIVMVDALFPDRTNRMIAEAIGCDEKTVRLHRPSQSVAENSATEKRKGKDGKMYKTRKSNIKSDSKIKEEPKQPVEESSGYEPEILTASLQESTVESSEPVAPEPDPEKSLRATEQEARIMETIDMLERQISEWFDLAPPEWIGEFEHRIQLRIRRLIGDPTVS